MQNDKLEKMKQMFPKIPYNNQIQLCTQLYGCLDDSSQKLVIAESPTGTGKTYGVLIPIMYWLSENPHLMQNRNRIKENTNNDTRQHQLTPSWLKKPQQSIAQKKAELKNSRLKSLQKLSTLKFQQKDRNYNSPSIQDIEDLFNNIDEQNTQINKDSIGKKTAQFQKKIAIFEQLEREDEVCLPKLIFVSRTHSQIEQILASIAQIPIRLRTVQLASKQFLCVNPSINTKNTNITDKCKHLLSNSSCQFYQNMKKNGPFEDFIHQPIKISQQLGKKYQVCPYYALRNIMDFVDIICLTYSSVLNSNIRKNLQLNINNSIIVFDEAHNLLNEEKSMKSPQISYPKNQMLVQSLTQYVRKYGQKMKIHNKVLLIHFIAILKSFASIMSIYLNKLQKQSYCRTTLLQLMLQMNMPELKVQKILQYMRLTNLDQKLINIYPNNRLSIGYINCTLEFLKLLIQTDDKIVVLIKKTNQNPGNQNKNGLTCMSLKMLCLESNELKKIIQEARLTVLMGGTMQPLSQYTMLLHPYPQSSKVLQYGHNITKEQCKVYVIGKYQNRSIIYNYKNTHDTETIDFLKASTGRVISSVAKSMSQGSGLVIFIQNYQMLPFYRQIITQLCLHCDVYYDDTGDDVFSCYKQSIVQKGRSALLVSVMGGKLSEGINFTDQLARKLIVFGLPYPNIKQPEIIQMMKHYDNHKATYNGQTYYQNLCIRTLNQTIGRLIRHSDDYGCIFLVDYRFSSMCNKLSNWLQDRIIIVQKIQNMI